MNIQVNETIKHYDGTNENYISRWYPKIKNCGLLVPATKIFRVPNEILSNIFGETDKEMLLLDQWLRETVWPLMDRRIYFLKNGTFSNKFDFMYCKTNKYNLLANLVEINTTAEMFGAGGIEEFALREFVDLGYNEQEIAKIYNGLPLHTEFRVFYDFDATKALYCVNYWDYDYVAKNLYSYNDKLVFESYYPKILKEYEMNKNKVCDLVEKHMQSVDLTGKYSIDIMMDTKKQFWLIDMALARNSAYWNESEE
jgi:hypothetical protein